MNLSLSLNKLNVTERISETTSIATSLVNITTPTQEPIYAEDINLAVDIVSTLNKYGHLLLDDMYAYEHINVLLYYCSVTETVVTNLTTNDTFFVVSMIRSTIASLLLMLCAFCLQDTISVINNLLSESNRNSWEQLERVMFAVSIV